MVVEPTQPEAAPAASLPLDRVGLKRLTNKLRSHAGEHAPRANKVDVTTLEAIYRQEPWTQRGILKQSGDLTKHGFRITQPDGTPHPLNDEFASWCDTVQLKAKLREAIISAHVVGDGVLELEWMDADGSPQVSQEAPGEDRGLVNVHVVDASYVRFAPFEDDSGREAYYLIQRPPTGAAVKLHPTRYQHLRLKSLPGYVHGLSTVEAAYHAALAKVKGDQGIGEILYHSGVPKLHGAIRNSTESEVEAVWEMFTDPDFTRGFVWDERLAVHPLNPQGIDPAPYYAALRSSIAAAIGLPVMMLEGAQAGAVTGSETNLDDYHSDISQVQINQLGPVVHTIFRGWAGRENAEGACIVWNEFPQNRNAEADGIEKRVTAWTLLVGQGVTPAAAARIAGLDIRPDEVQRAPPPNHNPDPFGGDA